MHMHNLANCTITLSPTWQPPGVPPSCTLQWAPVWRRAPQGLVASSRPCSLCLGLHCSVEGLHNKKWRHRVWVVMSSRNLQLMNTRHAKNFNSLKHGRNTCQTQLLQSSMSTDKMHWKRKLFCSCNVISPSYCCNVACVWAGGTERGSAIVAACHDALKSLFSLWSLWCQCPHTSQQCSSSQGRLCILW